MVTGQHGHCVGYAPGTVLSLSLKHRISTDNPNLKQMECTKEMCADSNYFGMCKVFGISKLFLANQLSKELITSLQKFHLLLSRSQASTEWVRAISTHSDTC